MASADASSLIACRDGNFKLVEELSTAAAAQRNRASHLTAQRDVTSLQIEQMGSELQSVKLEVDTLLQEIPRLTSELRKLQVSALQTAADRCALYA